MTEFNFPVGVCHVSVLYAPRTSPCALYIIKMRNLFQNMELDLVIDVHAHSSLHGVFTYGNAYDDVYRSGRIFLNFLIRITRTARRASDVKTYAEI